MNNDQSSLVNAQQYRDGCAFTELALELDFRTKSLCRMSYDRKPKACAAEAAIAAAGDVALVESFKHPGLVLRRNTAAGVADPENRVLVGEVEHTLDLPARWRELDGVVHQVAHD